VSLPSIAGIVASVEEEPGLVGGLGLPSESDSGSCSDFDATVLFLSTPEFGELGVFNSCDCMYFLPSGIVRRK